MTQFATSAELAARLGITYVTGESARADTLLALASGLIQEESGQTISLVSDDTYTRPGSPARRVRLPERPVVSVDSVTLDGTELVEGDAWYLDGDEIVRTGFITTSLTFGIAGSWGTPEQDLVVVYTHGWSTIPSAVKAVCLEMVARAWVNPGQAIQEQVGATMTGYPKANGLLLTDDERDTINRVVRRTAGSITLR